MILIKQSDTQYLDPEKITIYAIRADEDINEVLSGLGITEEVTILDDIAS